MNNAFFIRFAEGIDPAKGAVVRGPFLIRDGRLAPCPAEPPEDAECVDAEGLTLCPGFIDLHVHLREPGHTDAETVVSGAEAAARGGFTSVVAMPNTNPPCDTAERVRETIARAARARGARVLPAACMTVARAGLEPTEADALRDAGAVALTDDGGTPPDREIVRAVLLKARAAGLPIMDHAQDPARERRGVMHEGARSRALGLPGIPAEAEVDIVRRDIELAEETGCAVHLQHLSAAGSVDLLRAALKRGAPVTAELTPHHLALTDDDVRADDANGKMNPPLRGTEDRQALQTALIDGTIGALATDHAPHTAESKARGFLNAPFGVVGLETAVGVTYTKLVREAGMDPVEWVRRWTTGPAAVIGRPAPSLTPGAIADLVLLDLRTPWKVESARFRSRSRNTPFGGRTLFGRAVCAWRDGVVVWNEAAQTIAV